MDARVTIAVPVYNGGAYLHAALDSAVRQTHPDVEVVVFDNASTDNTREIAESFGGAVRLVTSDVNKGSAWNFNRAALECRTPFFMWLAADDVLDPRFVATCMQALEANASAEFALTGINYVDPDGLPIRAILEDGRLGDARLAVRCRSYLDRSRWTEVYSLYRTACLTSTSLFRPVFASDVLLVWEMVLRGPAAIVPQALLSYREYPTKTVQEMAESLLATDDLPRWPKLTMWRRLWAMVGDAPALDAPARRAARRELLRMFATRTWLFHVLEDVEGEAARRGSAHPLHGLARALRGLTRLAAAATSLLRRLMRLGRVVSSTS